MTTPTRHRVLSVLFDKPQKGWVAVQTDHHCAPLYMVVVPQRAYTSANDVFERRDATGRIVGPTAFARKHAVQPIAHWGRWGAYLTPEGLLIVARDSDTLISALIECRAKGWADPNHPARKDRYEM